MRQAEAVDGQVGCGVIAENHHEVEGVAEGEGKRRGELAEHARACHLIVVRQDHLLSQRGLSGANLLRGVQQDAHFNDRRSLDR